MDKHTTTVANRYKQQFDVYIGRGTPFGNPYIIGIHGDRQQVISLYRKYFYDRIATEPTFCAQVESLRGKVLGCSCKPQPCHGDIIAEYLNKELTR